MELRNIKDPTIFDQFVENNTYGHYMKTSMWGEFQKRTMHYAYELKGFYEDDQLIGTALLQRGSWLGHSFIYVQKGPCIDYENQELYKKAFTLLQQYADKEKVQFLRVDPNVVRVPHDIKGNVLEGFNHEYVTEDLKSLGYIHKGYGYAYNGSWTNRYTLIVDLSPSMDEVVKRYARPRRTSLNRHKAFHVSTRVGTEKDIKYIMEFEQHLSWQDSFPPHSYEFFHSLFELFKEHCVIYVTEIDLQGMIDGLQEEVQGKKYKNDLHAKQATMKKIDDAKHLMSLYGSKLPIAAGLFLRFGDTSWDLYTYNHKDFIKMRPVDDLHYFAMKDMKEHGVIHYDMVGFSGVTTPDDPEYGLYDYKSSFGPEYIEQIGEFDYVRNPNAMKRFRFEKLAINHLKRNFWKKKYHKDAQTDDYVKLHKSVTSK